MTDDPMELFSDSLERCLRSDGFLSRFYDLFIAASPVVAAKFENTDIEHQKRMLKASFHMLSMSTGQPPASLDYMQKLASRHSRQDLDIPPEMYDIWLDCLIQAVREHDDRFDEELERCWRVVWRPQIDFLISKYDEPAEQSPP